MSITLFMRDLMLLTRTSEALKGITTTKTAIVPEEVGPSGYVVLDLEEAGAMDFLKAHPARCVAICSHTNVDLLKEAKAFGCKHVYARSYFFTHAEQIIEPLLKN